MQVVPTILEKDFYEAERKIARIAPEATWIQIDVVDDEFAPGKSFELELLNKLEVNTEKLLWEIHLMVKEPINWLKKCQFVGASRVVGQVEMMASREEFLAATKELGMEAGLAFDIDTKVEGVAEETDEVLLLTRKAGFGSFEVDKEVWQKIEKLEGVKIGVDGGVTLDNIDKFKEAGVDIAYCGGAIFNGNALNNLRQFRLYEN